MIPKIIHYCWFGGKDKPSSFEYCLATWRKYLPDYEIKEWNETNFNISESIEFVKEAYNQKKWAFVSDYVRIYALLNNGGIYMDTDVEVKNNLDEFLIHNFFIGLEKEGFVSTALIGSIKNHSILLDMINYYQNQSFEIKTSNQILSSILTSKYAFDNKNNNTQEIYNNIYIYSNTYFSIDIPKNYATPWNFINRESAYKNSLHVLYYLDELNKIPYAKRELNNMINNQKIIDDNYLLDLIPLKNILSYLKKKLINKFFKF
ncbi:glycosyltransferase [Chishuiella sp.]|uniref:glycosyltransferase family 32 protein n=1 Tax=Chishuiella sp. TaxID=1969467 RepID=UPI0028AAD078|nr:glycosyltransferase [Chishuiella sp.]